MFLIRVILPMKGSPHWVASVGRECVILVPILIPNSAHV